jgi:hypothetical protein
MSRIATLMAYGQLGSEVFDGTAVLGTTPRLPFSPAHIPAGLERAELAGRL